MEICFPSLNNAALHNEPKVMRDQSSPDFFVITEQ